MKLFLIKKFYLLLRISRIYNLNDFYYKDDLNSFNLQNKKSIFPNEKSQIKVDSINQFKKGWYLFGLKHKSNNHSCYSKLIVGNSNFYQGRPFFPHKYRWRIIHINKLSNVSIIFSNINAQFTLKELWVIPIPFLEAWRRIRKRCKGFDSDIPKFITSKQQILKYWVIYNKELSKQSNFFKYKDWQTIVESKLLNDIKKSQYKKYHFNIQDPENPNFVKGCEYVIALKSKDKLPQYIFNVINYFLNYNNNIEIIFTDEDFIDEYGKRYNPNFKCAWNRELFWSNPSVNNSWIISKENWNKALNYLKNNNYSLNLFSIVNYITFDLEVNNKFHKIKHLPFILYHNTELKKNKSIEEDFNKINFLHKFINSHKSILGSCEKIEVISKKSSLKFSWATPKETLISIIIPTKDKVEYLSQCINSIEKYDPGIPYEICLINNDSREEKTKLYFKEFLKNNHNNSRKIINIFGEFNFSKMNNYAVNKSRGNIIIFVNNDIKFIHKNWGYELAANALRPKIGFVGCKLYYDDDTIQHAGVVLGIGGIAGHAFKYYYKNDNGYFYRLNSSQEFSALTAACLAISKENWNKLKGFDETNLPVNYNDVDICLEARMIGLRNLFLPSVEAYHFESRTRGKVEGKKYKLWKKESKFIKNKWSFILYNDPSYSPYLSLIKEDFSKTMKIPENLNLRSSSFETFKKQSK